MSNYNYYCGNCFYRLGEDDEEDHKEKFHCDDEDFQEFDDFKIIGKEWIFDIFDQLEMAEELLYVDKKKLIEGRVFFSAQVDLNSHLYGRRPRIAYILIDNAVELLLYGKIFLTNLIDSLSSTDINNAKKFIEKKLEILVNHSFLSSTDKNMVMFFHIIRNKLYHNIIPDGVIFVKMANSYLVFCRDLLLKLYDIVYPIIYYKETFKFEETEIVNVLLKVLKKSLKDFKWNIRSMKEIYDIYIHVKKKYKNELEYIIDSINPHFGSVDSSGKFTFPQKYDRNILSKILNSYIKFKKRSIDTSDKVKNILGEIFKILSEVYQINNYLSSSMEMFYFQLELFED